VRAGETRSDTQFSRAAGNGSGSIDANLSGQPVTQWKSWFCSSSYAALDEGQQSEMCKSGQRASMTKKRCAKCRQFACLAVPHTRKKTKKKLAEASLVPMYYQCFNRVSGAHAICVVP
jgi:hypothetical protein